jgi:broad specificity phosphatase PhoE
MLLVRHGQSLFNVAYAATRQDPGIPDPELTKDGRRQAEGCAQALLGLRQRGEAEPQLLITSPYTRTLQTASIIAEALDLPVTVEPLVRERAAFVCDVGTAPADLGRRFPRYRFDHLDPIWWHDFTGLGAPESEDSLAARGQAFRSAMARRPDWRHVIMVTHWGFISALTGLRPLNGEIVRFAPRP